MCGGLIGWAVVNVQDILLEGLTHCPYSESLLVKALKHEERIGNLPGARSLMSRLKAESVERTWKTVLEGGLLEARAGNLHVAREVFKVLLLALLSRFWWNEWNADVIIFCGL